jgi:hypothetical protein
VKALEHPKDIGDRTTLAVMLALRDLGLGVLVPFGENARYDLVIDDGTSLSKVQCKTGRLRNGAVRWSVCSNYAHHRNPRVAQRDYQGEVDFFGVYCSETGGVYWFPLPSFRCVDRERFVSNPQRIVSGSSYAPARNTRSGA